MQLLACRCGNVWRPWRMRYKRNNRVVNEVVKECPICSNDGSFTTRELLDSVAVMLRKDQGKGGGPIMPHGRTFGYEYGCIGGGKVRRISTSMG